MQQSRTKRNCRKSAVYLCFRKNWFKQLTNESIMKRIPRLSMTS